MVVVETRKQVLRFYVLLHGGRTSTSSSVSSRNDKTSTRVLCVMLPACANLKGCVGKFI